MVVFVRSIVSGQIFLLGFPREFVIWFSFIIFLSSSFVGIALWFYPQTAPARFFHWCMRFLRELIIVLSLLGTLVLLMQRIPIISLRGGISYGVLLLVIGIEYFLRPAGLENIPHKSLEVPFATISRWILKIGNWPTRPLNFIIAFLPVGIVCFYIYFVLDADLSDYGPYSFWNDEASYWVWLRSFSYVGLNSGNNAPNELLASLEISRYGEASPYYIYVYGLLAQAVGWYPFIPVLINFILLFLSILLFVHLINLDIWQVIFVGLAVNLTWPVLLFLPITAHETLNQSIGIVLAIVFIKLLTRREAVPTSLKVVFVLFVYFATLVRLSWGLLLIPVLFYSLNGSFQKRGILSVLLGFGLFASAVVLMGILLPPINNSILETLRDGPGKSLLIIFEKLYPQIALMLESGWRNPNISIMFQMALVIGWSGAYLFRSVRARISFESIAGGFAAFHFYNVTSLLFAGLTFYLIGGFYRTFAPAMLIVFLLLVYRRNYRQLSALLVVNVIFFSSYVNLNDYGDLRIIQMDYTSKIPQATQIQAEIKKYVVYDSEAENPWCNTLLIPLRFYDSRLTLLPPGIGVSYILRPLTFQLPIKSRYVLFDAATYETYRDQANLDLLTSLPIGDLYKNLDANCPGTP
jgi:hypothetical protein